MANLLLIWLCSFLLSSYVVYGEEINTCDTYGLCSQQCSPKGSTFQCSCTHGFQLASDNRTCNPRDDTWKLIYVYKDRLNMVTKHTSGQETKLSFSNWEGYSHSVTYDARNDVLYWINDASDLRNSVHKCKINGSTLGHPEVVANRGLSNLRGIAYDWITGNVYFADISASRIVVCGNSSDLCAVVVHNTTARDIALHPNLGLMFWDNSEGIWRADMDGGFATRIVTLNTYLLYEITVDQGGGRVYWADFRNGKIESCRLDGTDRRVILRSKVPIGIDVLGHRLFWSEDLYEIKSANKLDGTDTKLHVRTSKHDVINGLTVVHLANQPMLRNNPCQHATCSHVCTLKPHHFRCLCPVGFKLDEHQTACIKPSNPPTLVMGLNNTLKFNPIFSEATIGKHSPEEVDVPGVQSIDNLLYNPANQSLIIRDSVAQKIFEYYHHQNNAGVRVLGSDEISGTTAMDIDPVSENLYWIGEGNHTLEVMSLKTGARRTICHLRNGTYQNLLVDSKEMWLYVKTGNEILKMSLDGSAKWPLSMKLNSYVSMAYDSLSGNPIWITENEIYLHILDFAIFERDPFTSVQGIFPSDPVDFAIFGNMFYWSFKDESFLSVVTNTNDSNYETYIPLNNQKGTFKLAIMYPESEYFKSLRSQHDCSTGNSNGKMCSHICLPTSEPLVGICKCPANFTLLANNRTCLSNELLFDCKENEFKCTNGTCLNKESTCEAIKLCLDDTLEIPENCEKTCIEGTILYPNGTCVDSGMHCDAQPDTQNSEGDKDSFAKYNTTVSADSAQQSININININKSLLKPVYLNITVQ